MGYRLKENTFRERQIENSMRRGFGGELYERAKKGECLSRRQFEELRSELEQRGFRSGFDFESKSCDCDYRPFGIIGF